MIKPFQINGVTYAVNANAASQIVGISADSPSSQLQFVNSGNAVVFFRIASNQGNTTTTAVPSPGSPGYGCALLPNTSLIYTGWQAGMYSNCSVSVITSSPAQTAMVYITPGEGR